MTETCACIPGHRWCLEHWSALSPESRRRLADRLGFRLPIDRDEPVRLWSASTRPDRTSDVGAKPRARGRQTRL